MDRTRLLALGSLVGLIVIGCAQGSTFQPGAGGAGGGDVGNGVGGAPMTTSGSTTATGGTTTTTTTGSAGGGTTTSSSTTTSSTTTTASTGTGVDCGPGMHFCGGVCTGNTPQTGCANSPSCDPCPAAPANGMLTCTAAGNCDFECVAPFQKMGNFCAGGGTTSSSVASSSAASTGAGGGLPIPCDTDDICAVLCLPQFKIGMCCPPGGNGTCYCADLFNPNCP